MRTPRLALSIGLIFVGSITASAQPTASPQPSIGLPLPPIGLPLPSLGLTPPGTSEPATPAPAPGPTPPVTPPPIVFFGAAPYAWGFEAWQQSSAPGVIATAPPADDTTEATQPAYRTGQLQLEVTPRHAQVFVDGEFVGTWSDLGGELDLTAGVHRVEIRAPDHEAVAIDVRIVAGRTITYRARLTPVELARDAAKPDARPRATPPDSATTAPPPPPPAPQTFYLIPGCYLGNVPPDQVKLPAGCDQRRVITYTPR